MGETDPNILDNKMTQRAKDCEGLGSLLMWKHDNPTRGQGDLCEGQGSMNADKQYGLLGRSLPERTQVWSLRNWTFLVFWRKRGRRCG